VLLGGHSVHDEELKFGFSVIGEARPDRLLINAAARPGDRLILTKPLGTGVLINAFKLDKLDASGLEPVLSEMERLNLAASRLALEHGVCAATDVTGFGFAGHALEIARASHATLRVRFDDLPIHDGFYHLTGRGVSTLSTAANRANAEDELDLASGLDGPRSEILFDPQTSGGLLIAVAAEQSSSLLAALRDSGHRAAEVGEVVEGPGRLEVA
jgi:selenide,water dikinase